MIERLLEDFTLTTSSSTSTPTRLTLTNPNSYTYTLQLVNPSTLRQTLTRNPDRPLPPQDNVLPGVSSKECELSGLKVDEEAKEASFQLGNGGNGGGERKKRVVLSWKTSLSLNVYETLPGQSSDNEEERRVFGTLNNRGFCEGEHGVIRYDWCDREGGAIRCGLGEKGAPLDLTHRAFELTGTDAAAYDAYHTDPLYKHTPYLMTLPKPITINGKTVLPSAVAQYHASNSDGRWDVQHKRSDPYGYFTSYQQDWAGLDEYIILGDGSDRSSSDVVGARELVRGFAALVGNPLLVPRDWLGYLASGMGLGESDMPIAQELLSTWPDTCRKHDIPCSAMHLSSGYTVGEDRNRYVFTMNKRRYPDFAAMVRTFHAAGIKLCPNIKPYVLATHPDYAALQKAGALFYDPLRKANVTTQIWSSDVGANEKGAWVDMTHPAGRKWWCDGVESLVKLGCDAMWNDNNEYLLHNDLYECANDMHRPIENAPANGTQAPIGVMGRMLNTQIMAEMSQTTMQRLNPDRRAFVLTRSANVGTMHHAASTWSGDNLTCWKTLRGSVAMGLNAGMSLIQSYGTDVGGFAGPLPEPELFVRWVQFGVTNSRFCIHSFKPTKNEVQGVSQTNTPWMYPEVLPIIRKEIKRRYAMMPYLNALNWESHESAEPPNAWLGFGPFAQDPNVWTEESLEGFDFWMGAGKLLVAGSYHKGQTSRQVYFPRAYPGDSTEYVRVSTSIQEVYKAGTTAQVEVPLDEFAIFARAGTAIPVGKPVATVTSRDGPSRSHIDGVKQVLVDEGGVVDVDDWRGVEIFPGTASSSGKGGYTWTEDDGVSANPAKTIVSVEYELKKDGKIAVQARFVEHAFETAWGNTIWIVMPKGDSREVAGAEETMDVEGKKAFKVTVQ